MSDGHLKPTVEELGAFSRGSRRPESGTSFEDGRYRPVFGPECRFLLVLSFDASACPDSNFAAAKRSFSLVPPWLLHAVRGFGNLNPQVTREITRCCNKPSALARVAIPSRMAP